MRKVQTYKQEHVVKNLDGSNASITVEEYRALEYRDRQKYLPLKLELVEDGIGNFIQYGSDFEEFDNGSGNFSTAIIQMPDGTDKNLPVGLGFYQFINEE